MSFIGNAFGANVNPGDVQNNVTAQTIGLGGDDLQKQNDFVKALQAQAAGGGPSVATQALKNATQQNAASTNALISGQRGVNAGMALRQGVQSNANANQGAAGQAAAAREQEQLNAQGMLGNQVNTMQQQVLDVEKSNQNAALGASSINADIAKQNATTNAGVAGGVMQGIGSMLTLPKLAEGGEVPDLTVNKGPEASPWNLGVDTNLSTPLSDGGPQSAVGKYISSPGVAAPPPSTPTESAKPALSTPNASGGQALGAGIASVMSSGPKSVGNLFGSIKDIAPMAAMLAKGGRVPAMVSPGERYLPPKEVQKVAKGQKSPMKAGERIPGKAKVTGDSYANDTVHKTLQSGGIVLPRHITQSKDAPQKAAAFVRAVLAKQNLKR